MKKKKNEMNALLFSAIIIAHLAQSNYAQNEDNDSREKEEKNIFVVIFFCVWSYSICSGYFENCLHK